MDTAASWGTFIPSCITGCVKTSIKSRRRHTKQLAEGIGAVQHDGAADQNCRKQQRQPACMIPGKDEGHQHTDGHEKGNQHPLPHNGQQPNQPTAAPAQEPDKSGLRYEKNYNGCNVSVSCRGTRRVSRPKRRKNEIAG